MTKTARRGRVPDAAAEPLVEVRFVRGGLMARDLRMPQIHTHPGPGDHALLPRSVAALSEGEQRRTFGDVFFTPTAGGPR